MTRATRRQRSATIAVALSSEYQWIRGSTTCRYASHRVAHGVSLRVQMTLYVYATGVVVLGERNMGSLTSHCG